MWNTIFQKHYFLFYFDDLDGFVFVNFNLILVVAVRVDVILDFYEQTRFFAVISSKIEIQFNPSRMLVSM